MKARIVVGAHYGLKDWLAQRVTAVIMAVYTLVLGIALLAGGADTQDSWRALMGGTFFRFVTPLFFISLRYHGWIGVRDIWMDYINAASVRVVLHVLTILALTGYAVWAIQIIWRL